LKKTKLNQISIEANNEKNLQVHFSLFSKRKILT